MGMYLDMVKNVDMVKLLDVSRVNQTKNLFVNWMKSWEIMIQRIKFGINFPAKSRIHDKIPAK